MRINPGGRLDVKDIVGRDNEVARYWQILARQGLVLSAERRIGKTHIALKMLEERPPPYLAFYQDLEGVHSTTELVRAIYRSVNTSIGRTTRLKGRFAEWSALVPKPIGAIDFPSSDQTWRFFLHTAFDDLVRIADSKVILMMWDEFPLMIYNIQQREGEHVAIEFLDLFRALRQQHADKIRFLLTGSIGLHLVLRSLKLAGNANDSVNDMYVDTVPPMQEADATTLAAELLAEVNIDETTRPYIAHKIANEVGGFPYYIHHVVDQLHQASDAISAKDVDDAINTLIQAAQDPANFDYYLSRLDIYYTDSERRISLAILDAIAEAPSPQKASQILNLVHHKMPNVDDEEARGVLRLLVEDHYLVRFADQDGSSTYEFRWTLVRRWWRSRRL